jgi:hypothetical protein
LSSLQTILALLFLAGIIGLIWTTIAYPKDVARGVFIDTPKAIFHATIGRLIDLIIIPFWLALILFDIAFKKDCASRLRQKISFSEKSKEKRYLNIHEFKRMIMIQGMTLEQVDYEIQELAETIKEFDMTEYALKPYGHAVLLELPNVGLYGFGLAVQWLDGKSIMPIYGLAKSRKYGFVFYQSDEVNELHGITSDGEKFTLELTNDLDKDAALILNPEVDLRPDFNYSSADATASQ